MNRNQQFFVNNVKTISACESEIVCLEGSSFEKQFEIEYFPSESHDVATCEGCCKSRSIIEKQIEQYYNKFPLCCDFHAKLTKEPWFDKRDFKGLPKMVADKVLFTHHHITTRFGIEDWKEDITSYIEYAITSFGQIPSGYGEPIALSKYLLHVIALQEAYKLEGEEIVYKDRQQYIINYIKNYRKPSKDVKTDLNLLIATYDKWYKNFPFEIKLFSSLKAHFSKQLPILSEKPKMNKYLGVAKVSLLTQERLLEHLISISNQILHTIDTTQLLEEEYISDVTKYQFDLKKKVHKLNQETLLKQYSKGEKKYIKTIKKWLENEKDFLKDIQPTIKELPAISIEDKSINNKSFRYKKYNECYSQLTDLMNALKKRNLIESNTDLASFRKIFSGESIDKQVIWIGNISELSYFIKQLHNELKYVEDLKQQQWAVTINCFIQVNNEPYDRTKLRTQKVPSTSKNIDLALNTLK